MNNKFLHNTVFVISFCSFMGIAVAETTDSEIDPLFNKQNVQISHNYILSEMYTIVNPEHISSDHTAKSPAQTRKNNSAMFSDNLDWIPIGWHSAY